jgi:hypothetical protein
MGRFLAALTMLLAVGAPAKTPPKSTRQRLPPDPHIAGLGRSCHTSKDCKHKAQRCLHQSDANGKPVAGSGFCALPCKTFEAGTTPVRPGFPAVDAATTKKLMKQPPPPRCPRKFQCRSAGSGVPIDMCVRE